MACGWRCSATRASKGYTPEQFYQVMSETAGTDLRPWFAKVAESTDELDYTEALDYFGLRFRPVDTRNARAFIGAGTRNDGGRLVVTSVRRGTPAIAAGLNVDDEILAIDDVRVRADGLAARLDQYKVGRQGSGARRPSRPPYEDRRHARTRARPRLAARDARHGHGRAKGPRYGLGRSVNRGGRGL